MQKIRFRTNLHKVNAVGTWLKQATPQLTPVQFIKVIFVAEQLHLNQHLRPITGLRYQAQDAQIDAPVWRAWLCAPSAPANLDYLSQSDVEALTQALRMAATTEYHFPTGPIAFEDMLTNPEAQILNHLINFSPYVVI